MQCLECASRCYIQFGVAGREGASGMECDEAAGGRQGLDGPFEGAYGCATWCSMVEEGQDADCRLEIASHNG